MSRNLLHVDDERANLVVFKAAFCKHFNILEAESGMHALELLRTNEVSVLVADHRMPEITGVELCEIVKREYPHIIRMILTGYTDSDAMMEAINKGQVYSFITKPWERQTLLPALLQAFEAHDLAVANSGLMERLDHAQRCAELGRCVAGIAHEMGNQLFILPLAELIERNYADNAELVEIARIARETHQRLEELINEVKSFVRAETSNARPTRNNLAQLVREAVSLVGLREGIPKRSLKLSIHTEPHVYCHKGRIQQVIFNLIKNAAEALTGHVNPSIEVTVGLDGEQAWFAVRDNGPGIAPENVERIWDSFFTTKGEAGTGLGLDVCRRIVESRGGRIECRSTPGGGACFTVYLPMQPPVEAPQESAPAVR